MSEANRKGEFNELDAEMDNFHVEILLLKTFKKYFKNHTRVAMLSSYVARHKSGHLSRIISLVIDCNMKSNRKKTLGLSFQKKKECLITILNL